MYFKIVILVFSLSISCPALASDKPPIDKPVKPVDVPLTEAKDLTSEVTRYGDRITVLHRPKTYMGIQTTACVPGRTMRVWWSDVHVCRTPNDPGSYEEWRSTLHAGYSLKELSWSVNFSPPDELNMSIDNYSQCWRYNVNKTGYLNEIHPTLVYIYQRFEGKESDTWPDPDDKLPKYLWVREMQNCVGNFQWMTDCGYSDDYKRYSCTDVQFYTY